MKTLNEKQRKEFTELFNRFNTAREALDFFEEAWSWAGYDFTATSTDGDEFHIDDVFGAIVNQLERDMSKIRIELEKLAGLRRK